MVFQTNECFTVNISKTHKSLQPLYFKKNQTNPQQNPINPNPNPNQNKTTMPPAPLGNI